MTTSQTINVRYVPTINNASDALLYGGFLAEPSRFDMERAVQDWLRAEVAAGRAAVRSYGPGAVDGYFIRTTRGRWLPLAIRNHRDGSAYSGLTGQSVVAATQDAA